MRPLSEDIVEFIYLSFHAEDIPDVFKIFETHAQELSTPRVQRAVLFLSGGSLSMLRHYAATALVDVREVLLRAEYVVDVGVSPMPIRDMTQRFDGKSAAEFAKESRQGADLHAVKTTPPGGDARSDGIRRHRHLINSSFALGRVRYTVTSEQHSDNCVRCVRRDGNIVSIVNLPLVFVMEQLSEHIELQRETY